jgi:hypothetical protein
VHELTRRHAVKAMAAGAAFATVAPESQAIGALPAPPDASPGPAAGTLAAASLAARLTGCPVASPESNPVREAYVLHCRSWDSSVYLYVDEQLKGFVQLTAQGFSLAAAAQAGDRPLAIRYWGHNPRWCGGAGRFDGALLAFDPRDLPGPAESGPG